MLVVWSILAVIVTSGLVLLVLLVLRRPGRVPARERSEAPEPKARITPATVALWGVVLLIACPYPCGGLAMLFFFRGDGHTSLSGEVVGPDGRAIAGATVWLFEAERESSRNTWRLTDEAGRYSVGLTHAPENLRLVLTVSKDWHRPYRHEFQSPEWQTVPKRIVLEPDPLPVVPQAPGPPD